MHLRRKVHGYVTTVFFINVTMSLNVITIENRHLSTIALLQGGCVETDITTAGIR